MGPTRTKTHRQQDEGPVAGPSQPRKDGKKHKHRPKHTMQEASGTPGLQKLKASLRQTRRLLAKDNLAADVRAETERRLKALEADLAVAERSKKERTLAVRYHKVKFFERQKVVRKLNQLKKQTQLEEDSDAEETLQSLRVDLNYILHYPKMKKYISLFPPELRSGETPQPSLDAGREEVRKWVREQMASGDLPAEPELHLDSRGGGAEWEAVSQPKKKKQEAAAMELDEDEEQDEFFDDDDE
uniref:rRNA-processing protein EFG1 n=1 Tax=Mycena chlorophos TaxID=658473 RepID=A0ABQ0M525_MYCCL|nr:predicted protein [Mycena chlorophos]